MKKKDAELIQRTLDGDQSAFTALVEKYQKGVHALAWQKIGDFHIAQEITQDAFLRAYRKLGTLKNHNLFSGWLYVIATRLCCEWLRKKRLPMQSLETVDTKEVDQVAYTRYIEEQREADADEIRRELVRDLLKKLPESERTVMTLHYLGEMTCESISEFLGVSPNTIRSRLSRARNRLKKEEAMIKENLSSFQLPTHTTENIMKEISRLNPVTPSSSKPLVPLAMSAASAVFVLLLMGIGTQRLSDFQKPYNLNAQSERTIEISEAQLVIDSPVKPAIRNQVGQADLTGESNGVGQKPDDPLFAAANADEVEVSNAKSEWVQTKGPEGGRVPELFTTTRGDVYAGTRHGLYRLTDDGQAWKFISNIKRPTYYATLAMETKWWPVVERQDTLYLATDTELLTSTDRGETWKTLCECPGGQLTSMVMTDGIPGAQSDMTIYLAYTNGVFRTDNLGKSWTPLSEGLKDKKIRAIAAIENTLFAGTHKGLFRFNNEMWEYLPISQEDKSGKTLDSIFALTASDTKLYVLAKKVNVTKHSIKTHRFEVKQIELTEIERKALVNPDWIELTNINSLPLSPFSLYRSTDLGESWDSITPKLGGTLKEYRYTTNLSSPLLVNKDGKIISQVNTTVRTSASGEKVIVMADKAGYYSGDAGETWTSLDNIDNVMYASDAVFLNANTFYRGGTQGIQRSTDGGESWHQFNTGLVNTNVKHLVVTDGILYANTESELVHSTDGGESWVHVPIDTGYHTRIVKSNGELYARDNNNGTHRFFRLSSEDNSFTSISEMPVLKNATKQTLIVEIDNNGVYHQPFPSNFVVTETAYYMENQNKLFRWKIGSLNWYDTGVTDIDGARKGSKSGVSNSKDFRFAASGDTVYVGKGDGHLMQSFDGGDIWNDVTANLPFPVERFNAITFAGKNVYVSTDKGVVRSSNGTDWHILTDAESRLLVVNRFAVNGEKVYCQSDQKIYQLKNDSDTWQQVTSEIPYPVTCLDVDGRTLYVGTSGRGVLRFALDE